MSREISEFGVAVECVSMVTRRAGILIGVVALVAGCAGTTSSPPGSSAAGGPVPSTARAAPPRDVNARGRGGETWLHAYCREGMFDEVRAAVSAGAEVNARDDSGRTALHYAVGSNRREAARAMVELLIGAGADVNAADSSGVTPL